MISSTKFGEEVYVSVWTRSDIVDMINLSEEYPNITRKQADIAVNLVFDWLVNVVDECNNPASYNDIYLKYEEELKNQDNQVV